MKLFESLNIFTILPLITYDSGYLIYFFCYLCCTPSYTSSSRIQGRINQEFKPLLIIKGKKEQQMLGRIIKGTWVEPNSKHGEKFQRICYKISHKNVKKVTVIVAAQGNREVLVMKKARVVKLCSIDFVKLSSQVDVLYPSLIIWKTCSTLFAVFPFSCLARQE